MPTAEVTDTADIAATNGDASGGYRNGSDGHISQRRVVTVRKRSRNQRRLLRKKKQTGIQSC
uniref:Uncharacterized protein n=1 Tax=Arundo donax TaxID=35708 RepID=A0A0A8ZBF3_ARUDO